MSKKSGSCGYTGRMHTMNRENIAKKVIDTEKSKVNLQLEHEHGINHMKKGDKIVYPEDSQAPCACKNCTCK